MGSASAGMSARALQKNHVLPKLVAELRDFEVAHANTVHKTSVGLQSEFLGESAGYRRGRGALKQGQEVGHR